jgi:hypothetical protein
MTAQVEKNRLRQLTPVNSIVFAEMLASNGRDVDVENYVSIIGTSLEHFRAVRHKVIKGRKHL